MPIPAGGVTVTQLNGPIGDSAPELILTAPYGRIESSTSGGTATYVADGIALAATASGNASVTYVNLGPGDTTPAQVPTGVGIRFQPTARRFDAQLGNRDGDWGVSVNLGLSSAFWDEPDGVFDFNFELVDYIGSGLGVWYEFALLDTGYWCLTAGGATVLDGSIGARTAGDWYIGATADLTALVDGADPGSGVVDSLWLYGVTNAPACRLFPREDGRGMSSAPRIHPAPRSGRIIGGHQ